MIRFIIEKFRSSPGPLREPRLLLADIAEELLDTALEYAGKAPKDHLGSQAPLAEPTPVEAPPAADQPLAAQPDAGDETAAPTRTREFEIDRRLERAVADRSNLHKQDFKVLAILWDAYQRGLVPLSAKAVSNHGEKIGLSIRHENVRKVVRMRLEKYVDFHNEGAGSGTIYRYVLNAAGREHFAATYLRDNE